MPSPASGDQSLQPSSTLNWRSPRSVSFSSRVPEGKRQGKRDGEEEEEEEGWLAVPRTDMDLPWHRRWLAALAENATVRWADAAFRVRCDDLDRLSSEDADGALDVDDGSWLPRGPVGGGSSHPASSSVVVVAPERWWPPVAALVRGVDVLTRGCGGAAS